MIRFHTTLAAAVVLLAGCAPVLPPETATRPLPPPWTDPVDSVELDALCASGNAPVACRKLAVRFFREGDLDGARRALSGGGCNGAASDACWRWGAAFTVSDRVFGDTHLAKVMFEAGCESGSMKACRSLYHSLLEPMPLFPEPPLREVRLSSAR